MDNNVRLWNWFCLNPCESPVFEQRHAGWLQCNSKWNFGTLSMLGRELTIVQASRNLCVSMDPNYVSHSKHINAAPLRALLWTIKSCWICVDNRALIAMINTVVQPYVFVLNLTFRVLDNIHFEKSSVQCSLFKKNVVLFKFVGRLLKWWERKLSGL